MRLWTVHPRYLDSKGLVAAWREALLAQKVLAGRTRGYKHHPQLQRFQEQRKPMNAIGTFLTGLAREAKRRGYEFDDGKILKKGSRARIKETAGQLEYEWEHLKAKLRRRAPLLYRETISVALPKAHPMFRVVPGGVREWEKR
jgi:hypothetical protein